MLLIGWRIYIQSLLSWTSFLDIEYTLVVLNGANDFADRTQDTSVHPVQKATSHKIPQGISVNNN